MFLHFSRYYSVSVFAVKEGSIAEHAGLRSGDVVIAVQGSDVRFCRHDMVIKAIKRVESPELRLTLQHVEIDDALAAKAAMEVRCSGLGGGTPLFFRILFWLLFFIFSPGPDQSGAT
jgi:hypothetical protein